MYFVVDRSYDEARGVLNQVYYTTAHLLACLSAFFLLSLALNDAALTTAFRSPERTVLLTRKTSIHLPAQNHRVPVYTLGTYIPNHISPFPIPFLSIRQAGAHSRYFRTSHLSASIPS